MTQVINAISNEAFSPWKEFTITDVKITKTDWNGMKAVWATDQDGLGKTYDHEFRINLYKKDGSTLYMKESFTVDGSQREFDFTKYIYLYGSGEYKYSIRDSVSKNSYGLSSSVNYYSEMETFEVDTQKGVISSLRWEGEHLIFDKYNYTDPLEGDKSAYMYGVYIYVDDKTDPLNSSIPFGWVGTYGEIEDTFEVNIDALLARYGLDGTHQYCFKVSAYDVNYHILTDRDNDMISTPKEFTKKEIEISNTGWDLLARSVFWKYEGEASEFKITVYHKDISDSTYMSYETVYADPVTICDGDNFCTLDLSDKISNYIKRSESRKINVFVQMCANAVKNTMWTSSKNVKAPTETFELLPQLTGSLQYISNTIVDNPVSVYFKDMPENAMVAAYKWQVNEAGEWIDIDSTVTLVDKDNESFRYTRFTPDGSYAGKNIRAVAQVVGYEGTIVSESRLVTKAVNYKMPVIPTAMTGVSEDKAYITVNTKADQEYVILDAVPGTIDGNIFTLNTPIDGNGENVTKTGFNQGQIYYIFTRFKETAGQEAGSNIKYSAITTPSSSEIWLSKISFGEYDDNTIYIPLNESVTLDMTLNPLNANKHAGFTFEGLSTEQFGLSLNTVAADYLITADKKLTITAKNTAGSGTLVARYGGSNEYGHWSVVAYDPNDLSGVMIALESLVDMGTITMSVGDSVTLNIPEHKLLPGYVNDSKYTKEYGWSINDGTDTTTATGETLNIEATESGTYKPGTYTIFANVKVEGKDAVSIAKYDLRIYPKSTINVESVELTPATLELKPGETFALTTKIYPINASKKTVTYESSDTTIATVDSDGVVTISPTATKDQEVSITVGVIYGEDDGLLQKTATSKIKVVEPYKAYTVEVINGKALDDDGNSVSEAKNGDTVILIANTIPGLIFDYWSLDSGDVTIENKNSSSTTFVMKETNVVVRANYRDSNEEIEEPIVTPTPTPSIEPKPTQKPGNGSSYDDGGPFTTDICGNIYDRWGNKIHVALSCKVDDGYVVPNTGVK